MPLLLFAEPASLQGNFYSRTRLSCLLCPNACGRVFSHERAEIILWRECTFFHVDAVSPAESPAQAFDLYHFAVASRTTPPYLKSDTS